MKIKTTKQEIKKPIDIQLFFILLGNQLFKAMIIIFILFNLALTSLLIVNAYEVYFAYSVLKPVWMTVIFIMGVFFFISVFSWIMKFLRKIQPEIIKEVQKGDGNKRRSNRQKK